MTEPAKAPDDATGSDRADAVRGVADSSGVGANSAPGSSGRYPPPDSRDQIGRTELPDQGGPGEQQPGAGGAPTESWDPTGLDLARSVVGSLTNSSGATARTSRGPNGGNSGGIWAATGSGSRTGRGSRVRGYGRVAGQAAYADLAGTSGAHPDDRDPQVLDSTIDRLVADRGWNTDVAVAGALSRWDQIVGPQIAQHCRAEGYADGVLTVRADSTAWATQVRLLAATLVRRLNEDLGDGTVTRIVVQGPTGYDWRKRGLGTRDARGPRDTFG